MAPSSRAAVTPAVEQTTPLSVRSARPITSSLSTTGRLANPEPTENALAKHLANDHPDKEGDQTVFQYKVESTDKSCLQRQVREGANLAASDADNILNSRTEYHQPSLQRITLTREPRGAES